MRLSLRSAVSASAAIAAVIGIVVGVQLASTADGQSPARTIDRGGEPLPPSGPLGGDGMPMDAGDGFPVTVIASTVTVNGTPTVKTVTVSKSPAPSTQAEVVGATATTTPITTTTTPPPPTTTTTPPPATTTTTTETPTPR